MYYLSITDKLIFCFVVNLLGKGGAMIVYEFFDELQYTLYL